WRLGRRLGIPACGWATGSDMRWGAESPIGRSVRNTLRHMNLVFYQSTELKALAARLLSTNAEALCARRHVVQARGVREPENFPGEQTRQHVRSRLHLADDQIAILFLGRIVRDKGLFELVEGFGQWARTNQRLVLLLVGSRPGHDETTQLQNRIRSMTGVNERIHILPGCPPDEIWDYFSASDIFGFPSFKEGMPNSLLEAMVAGLPAVAFGIPSVQEITRFGQGLVEVPPYDFSAFGSALRSLAADSSLRRTLGEKGRSIAREYFSIDRSMRAVVDRIRDVTR